MLLLLLGELFQQQQELPLNPLFIFLLGGSVFAVKKEYSCCCNRMLGLLHKSLTQEATKPALSLDIQPQLNPAAAFIAALTSRFAAPTAKKLDFIPLYFYPLVKATRHRGLIL